MPSNSTALSRRKSVLATTASCYHVLGISRDASVEEVRAAFFRKALAAHPDNGGSDAAFRDVVLALETLSDAPQRAQHDAHYFVGIGSTPGRPTWPLEEGRAKSACSGRRENVAATPDFSAMPPSRTMASVVHAAARIRAAQKNITRSMHFEKNALLLRLRQLLNDLPRDRRRAVFLDSFSEWQRLALERWMVAERASLVVPPATAALTSSVQFPGVPELLRSVANAIKEAEPSVPALVRPILETVSSNRAAAAPPAKRNRCCVQGVTRVLRKGGRYRYYYASTTLAGLRLITRTNRELSMVLQFHVALLTIKQRTCSGIGKFEARFCTAVGSTLTELGLDAKCIGLKFRVILRPLWAETHLRSRSYNVPSGLEAGLVAWRCLTNARGDVSRGRHNVMRVVAPAELDLAWSRLRHEYLGVMVQAGCSQEPVSARLDQLERKRQAGQERQAQRWNQVRMVEEDNRQQRSACVVSERIMHCPCQVRQVEMGNLQMRREGPAATAGIARTERSIKRLLVLWTRADARCASTFEHLERIGPEVPRCGHEPYAGDGVGGRFAVSSGAPDSTSFSAKRRRDVWGIARCSTADVACLGTTNVGPAKMADARVPDN